MRVSLIACVRSHRTRLRDRQLRTPWSKRLNTATFHANSTCASIQPRARSRSHC